jgi:hypothetical protein
VLLLSCACRDEKHGSLQLVLGEGAAERPTEVELSSAYGEFIALPELRNELRITLSDHKASCAEPTLPQAGQLSVVVTVATPPGLLPASGTYDWAGHVAHGGAPERPERPYALPLLRKGSRAYEFQPGGSIELRQLALHEGGTLVGLLNFDFAGNAEHPAQAIKGSFSGRVCRSQPAPGDAD